MGFRTLSDIVESLPDPACKWKSVHTLCNGLAMFSTQNKQTIRIHHIRQGCEISLVLYSKCVQAAFTLVQ